MSGEASVGDCVSCAMVTPPEVLLGVASVAAAVRARPKSMSLAPDLVIITLPGLKSR